ncbi:MULTISPECIES: ABC transporter ATP-binding protein [Brevibacillus]|jgi:peptide/nickel transport system ATP-binding protein|uniref:Oligopeptide/dipeptide ABC transporter ATPase subunit n=1 Tax=Brevibacillus borstelensis AK1 TaxID=1300222 RepID=M8DF30_9BACL|nr:ABC transporter ATP-binding protein [Brevibacillus borstelensis]EMT52063.1 oligopeptide/dipeptide ABC transporter ATPase subunit [Brevibacillus borstelensis AK1]KKX53558.1 peptide ABC transporter ATP-binding protein [Brevibacillus borstelensis cifa_chp40]MBE5396051.1 ABC transporter ATP-binding protein [Brevibacillus borstelensis]MCC0566618.1 ABC transporter ATP-binding protein [Brevibacillus borstelensis]MCM3624624.1 ABC transporter ATP-binding protein [Brevibacillus borstelensis]
MQPILQVEDLHISFRGEDGDLNPVSGIDFRVHAGETLGIVGESGCGKSVTSLAIMGLLPKGIGRVSGGRILFQDKSIADMSQTDLQKLRGNEIAMIFQEPMTSLNPVYTIGEQLGEQIRLHLGLGKREARERAIEMLRMVGIPRAEEIVKEYPHQLSGGMRQRVMIAMAMSCDPKLLIADEPTTALDVTIQAQILDLMRELKEKRGTSIIFITHDLGVVAEMCDRVVVMYAGQVIEEAAVRELFQNPQHPYTKGLIASIPSLHQQQRRLNSIRGTVPHPSAMPGGCRFAPRCDYVRDECSRIPPLLGVGEGHKCRCWLVKEGGEEHRGSFAAGT